MNALRSERGSVALGGLTKLLLLLGLVGVLVYDGVSIAYHRVSAADHGASAADVAGETWRQTQDAQAAYEAAQATLSTTGEVIIPQSFSIDPSTDTVRFTLTTTAKTLAAYRLSITRGLTEIEATIETSSVAPST